MTLIYTTTLFAHRRGRRGAAERYRSDSSWNPRRVSGVQVPGIT